MSDSAEEGESPYSTRSIEDNIVLPRDEDEKERLKSYAAKSTTAQSAFSVDEDSSSDEEGVAKPILTVQSPSLRSKDSSIRGANSALTEKLFWDGRYVGQLRDDKREGLGTMSYFTGEVYEGEWKEDKWYGEGVYLWKNGDKYYGSFKEMKRNGYGRLILHNGNFYEGEFTDDKMDGTGMYKWANGDMYQGTFKRGMRDGFGTMTFSDGSKYVGQWKNNDRSGVGEWLSNQGERKCGVWRGSQLINSYTNEKLVLDRLFRCYIGDLSHVEESLLYQYLVSLEIEDARVLLEKHRKDVEEADERDKGGLSFLRSTKDQYLRSIKLNKESFDLTNKKLYVFKPVQQKIKISNYGKCSVSFSFRCYAKRNYNITFAPANFKLAAGTEVKVKISITPLKACTGSDIIILELQSEKRFARHLLMMYYQSVPLEMDIKQYEYDQIRVGEIIGQGSYGVVQLVKLRENGEEVKVAVKEFRLDLESMEDRDAETVLVGFESEMNLARMLRHNNVVKFLGACTQFPKLCIVLEYVPLGGFDGILKNTSNQFTWSLILKFALDIAQGMAYLHQCNVIHRDLKSANLLVESISESDPVHIKIADFGISRIVDRTRTGFARTMTKQVGTILWSAPEVLRKEKYNEKADVHSFGVILWEMVTRFYSGRYHVPYEHIMETKKLKEAIQKGDQLKAPAECPVDFKLLMSECCNLSYHQRPSFEEIAKLLETLRKKL